MMYALQRLTVQVSSLSHHVLGYFRTDTIVLVSFQMSEEQKKKREKTETLRVRYPTYSKPPDHSSPSWIALRQKADNQLPSLSNTLLTYPHSYSYRKHTQHIHIHLHTNTYTKQTTHTQNNTHTHTIYHIAPQTTTYHTAFTKAQTNK